MLYVCCICRKKELLGTKNSIDQLTETLEELDMDENARKRIKVFLNQKEKIGELSDQDLEKLGELGSGNGGVVMMASVKICTYITFNFILKFFHSKGTTQTNITYNGKKNDSS